MNTIRSEIRQIVDEAKRAGKPITSQIIWGLLTREVPEDSFVNLLSMMVRAEQLVKLPGPGVGKGSPGYYEPGPKPLVEKRGAIERFGKSMGFMAHRRLEDAKAAAMEWAGQEAVA